jgi:hypothetical protein
MSTRFMRTCGVSFGLFIALSAATVVYGASTFPTVRSDLGHADGSSVIPVWWYGKNGGICIHTSTGAVQCRPSYGHQPNPAYYRPGHTWVSGHWFRGRWIAGHWS